MNNSPNLTGHVGAIHPSRINLGPTNGAEESRPPVHGALDELDKALHILFETKHFLENRLEPALTPHPSQDRGTPPEGEHNDSLPTQSHLTARVRLVTNMAHSLNRELNTLIVRLEV